MVVSDFTRLLAEASEGNDQAKQEFSELVYEELRKLAAKVVARRIGRILWQCRTI